MKLIPRRESTFVEIADLPAVGNLLVWLPECVMSDSGCCAIYPFGAPWEGGERHLRQRINTDGIYGGGNCPRVDERHFECCGIRFPVDAPVSWTAEANVEDNGVVFSVRLRNEGATVIRKVAAAICVKFLDGSWWNDDCVYVWSDGKRCSLAELGRDAGDEPNGFQAYLLRGEEYHNVFYQRFWGFNRHRLDRALMVSEHYRAGVSVGVEAESAYFLHSNLHNPCTDLMLAGGDVAPNAETRFTGRVWVRPL